MSTEALRKAVADLRASCGDGSFAMSAVKTEDVLTALQALRDQESALATHRANYDALVIRLGEVTARLEAADGLLRELSRQMSNAADDLQVLPELQTASICALLRDYANEITAHLGGEHV